MSRASLRPHAGARRATRTQRGVATLLVVMGLFFLVSMVAAYTSRNLIFEQRTSANQYRATQAFEAAEAGLDWALAQLNAGRINAACEPTADTGFNSFRQRYVPELVVTSASGLPGAPGCRLEASNQWTCGCADATATTFAASATQSVEPAFRVRFREVAKPAPGFLTIESTGCTAADDTCLSTGNSRGAAGGAAALVSQLAALVPALATRPVAAVTVLGNIENGAALNVVNSDATVQGITVLYASGEVSGLLASSVAGSANTDSSKIPDTGMGNTEVFFERYLGMSEARFQAQPSTVKACETGGSNCLDEVLTKWNQHPGRPIWVMSDLVINQPGLGSTDAPVLLVVKGSVTLSAGIGITGVVYSRNNVTLSGATGVLRGALLTEGGMSGNAPGTTVVYDRAVIDKIRSSQGTIVRVPGGWKDF